MRTLPRRLLPSSVSYQASAGHTATGPTFSAAVTLAARVRVGVKRFKDAAGNVVVSDAQAQIEALGAAVPEPEGLVTFAGVSYRVLKVEGHPDPMGRGVAWYTIWLAEGEGP